MNIVKDLRDLKCGKVLEKVNLKSYNTYKIEATALVMVFPSNVDELKKLMSYVKKNSIKHKILGNGSNLVFNDGLYDGILIRLDAFKDLKVDDTKVTVGAGYNLMKLAINISRLGLTGLEFATGIPGTVGGAVYMNAGAYKSDMGYVVSQIKVLTPNGEIKAMYNKELDFHYRTSFLQKNPNYICLEATIVLKQGDRDAIINVIENRKKRRLMTQPLEYPSAGSVFRNPENDFAGRLIEEIGYKGKRLGGAQVSDKHANFIINYDKATGKDIRTLILEIQEKVKNAYGIELKIEQEFIE